MAISARMNCTPRSRLCMGKGWPDRLPLRNARSAPPRFRPRQGVGSESPLGPLPCGVPASEHTPLGRRDILPVAAGWPVGHREFRFVLARLRIFPAGGFRTPTITLGQLKQRPQFDATAGLETVPRCFEFMLVELLRTRQRPLAPDCFSARDVPRV